MFVGPLRKEVLLLVGCCLKMKRPKMVFVRIYRNT